MYIPADNLSDNFDKYDEPRLHMAKLLQAPLTDFDISLRLLFPLEKVGVRKLGQLVKFHRRDILKIPGIGRTGRKHLEDFLNGLLLSFGMK